MTATYRLASRPWRLVLEFGAHRAVSWAEERHPPPPRGPQQPLSEAVQEMASEFGVCDFEDDDEVAMLTPQVRLSKLVLQPHSRVTPNRYSRELHPTEGAELANEERFAHGRRVYDKLQAEIEEGGEDEEEEEDDEDEDEDSPLCASKRRRVALARLGKEYAADLGWSPTHKRDESSLDPSSTIKVGRGWRGRGCVRTTSTG